MSDIKFGMSKADGLAVGHGNGLSHVGRGQAPAETVRSAGHALPPVGGFSYQAIIEAAAPAYGEELSWRINDLVAQPILLGFEIVPETEAA